MAVTRTACSLCTRVCVWHSLQHTVWRLCQTCCS